MLRFSLALFSALLLSAPAQAAIYKIIDADGNVTFTDQFRPGATKLADTPEGPATAGKPNTTRGKRHVDTASPRSFPKVDPLVQRQRDDIRRVLLLEERGKEEKSLAADQANLNTPAKRSPSDLAKLNTSIKRHQKNIEMLDLELGRIK